MTLVELKETSLNCPHCGVPSQVAEGYWDEASQMGEAEGRYKATKELIPTLASILQDENFKQLRRLIERLTEETSEYERMK